MFSENQASRQAQALRLPRWLERHLQGDTMVQIGTQELNRLRWQCRRGLLELDLVLERFLEKHGDRLQGEYLSSFEILLTHTDGELWDLICARTECRNAALAEVVKWMRDCRNRASSQASANGENDDDEARS